MAKFYVGNSEIEGRGLFASKNISKGEIVFIMKGRIIKLNKNNAEKIFNEPDIMGIDKDLWIDPIPPYKYINHSCNPNAGIRGRVTFVALRNIKKDEEITFDYYVSEDSLWNIKCCCGSKNCRKIIRGIRFIHPESFKKYASLVPTHFKKIYKKHNIHINNEEMGKVEKAIRNKDWFFKQIDELSKAS